MKKVLIANRGEIACRVIRSCRELGIATVAVYSEVDRDAVHVALADESYLIGPARAQDSYLNIPAIMAAAEQSGADAIHPGYGFLAENSGFARQVLNAGRVWVGPRPDSIDAMGDKERARNLARAAHVPVVPGTGRFARGDLGGIARAAEDLTFPLLVKAAAGGGGIGMQRVNDPADLSKAVESTQALAERAFGDGTVYLERYVTRARHIEVQLFGFGDGRVIHLFERECSVQRRFQKIIEEAPAPRLDPAILAQMTAAATSLASHQRYEGAGTVEFVFDDIAQEFYFLEMNTRIQVEHPVTEMTTGLDLVALQLRQAAGDDLSTLQQRTIERCGHAIECRIYAENPVKNFMPAPGRLDVLAFPAENATCRIDRGVREGDQVTPYYDPMIAKVIVGGRDRHEAIQRSIETLEAIRLQGVKTNLAFLGNVLRHPAFAAGELHTHFVDAHKESLLGMAPTPREPVLGSVP